MTDSELTPERANELADGVRRAHDKALVCGHKKGSSSHGTESEGICLGTALAVAFDERDAWGWRYQGFTDSYENPEGQVFAMSRALCKAGKQLTPFLRDAVAEVFGKRWYGGLDSFNDMPDDSHEPLLDTDFYDIPAWVPSSTSPTPSGDVPGRPWRASQHPHSTDAVGPTSQDPSPAVQHVFSHGVGDDEGQPREESGSRGCPSSPAASTCACAAAGCRGRADDVPPSTPTWATRCRSLLDRGARWLLRPLGRPATQWAGNNSVAGQERPMSDYRVTCGQCRKVDMRPPAEFTLFEDERTLRIPCPCGHMMRWHLTPAQIDDYRLTAVTITSHDGLEWLRHMNWWLEYHFTYDVALLVEGRLP